MEHSDSDSFQDSMRPVTGLGLNNTRSQPDPSRSNSLMSETSSQPDIHPFFKVGINLMSRALDGFFNPIQGPR